MATTREEVIADVTAFVQRKYGGDWKKAFDAEDTDGDGQISRSELCAVLAKAGVGLQLRRWAIALEVIRVMDKDGDGMISFDEFQKMTHITSDKEYELMEAKMTTSIVAKAVGFSWDDVQVQVRHVLHLLDTQGEAALGIVTGILKLLSLVSAHDMTGIFAQLQQSVVDVGALAQAIRDEFGV